MVAGVDDEVGRAILDRLFEKIAHVVPAVYAHVTVCCSRFFEASKEDARERLHLQSAMRVGPSA